MNNSSALPEDHSSPASKEHTSSTPEVNTHWPTKEHTCALTKTSAIA